ncbi:MAG: osmoprotectant transport system substrate-binding protein [Actinomycetota bacterium]|jgi:osmoprotectant transport system substrate-binding protein|nr:osmoprotectant transport system substrate-binding protein [Actinomycetota bacterium]
MRKRRGAAGAVVALVLLLTAAACGGSGGGAKSSSTTTKAKGSVVIGSANFSENVLLANLYAKALEDAGYKTTVRANLGAREVIFPALEKGEIDMIPEYLGNALAFVAKDAGKPGDDVAATTKKLSDALKSKQLSVLEPSDATDGDILAVTKATADKDNLKKLSDLGPYAKNMTLGGPPECPTRITCELGLEQVYGLKFKGFKALDTGGPITKTALEKGDVDIARLFSADASIKEKNFVILDDDKFIQLAGNVVPVIRTSKVDAEITKLLNKVSSTLTTDDLIAMNTKIDVDKQDPDKVAQDYLVSKKLIKG